MRLGEITGLPVLELKKIFWRPTLMPRPRDQWIEVQRKLVDTDRWIMDGDLGPYDAVEARVRAADGDSSADAAHTNDLQRKGCRKSWTRNEKIEESRLSPG